jgi:glycosyltransferase involved in cell wall biosynthesis
MPSASHRESMPSISVVIPVRGPAGMLRHQLAALASQTYAGWLEVLVVDNGASADVGELVEGFKASIPRLQLLAAPGRGNVAYARNVGSDRAEGEFLLYCDADDAATPTWIEEMERVARSADLVAGSHSWRSLNESLSWAWRAVTLPTGPPSWTYGVLPLADGASFGIWRDVLEEVGGWNEAFVQGQDIELSWRSQLGGYTLAPAPAAVMEIGHRSTLRGFAKQRIGYGIARAHLYAEFRGHGMRRDPPRIVLRTWGSILFRLPGALRDPAARALWVRRSADALGELIGSVRYLVLYL